MCHNPELVRDNPLGAPASVKLALADKRDFSCVVLKANPQFFNKFWRPHRQNYEKKIDPYIPYMF